MMSERFVFFGTGANFSLAVFEQLVERGKLPIVIVVPEYPAYRPDVENMLTIDQPAISNRLIVLANSLDIPLLYAPAEIADDLYGKLSNQAFDFLLVACWRYKLSKTLCELAAKAALNLHPSLLPAYRGIDPVGEQIKQQERKLGVSLHLLSNEFDAGDVVRQAEIGYPVKYSRNIIEQNAAKVGVKLFIEASKAFGGPEWRPRLQNSS